MLLYNWRWCQQNVSKVYASLQVYAPDPLYLSAAFGDLSDATAGNTDPSSEITSYLSKLRAFNGNNRDFSYASGTSKAELTGAFTIRGSDFTDIKSAE